MYLLEALTMLQPGLSGVMLGSKCLGAALEYSLLHTREELVRQEVARGVLKIAIALRETSQVCLSRESGEGSKPMHALQALYCFCSRPVRLTMLLRLMFSVTVANLKVGLTIPHS